MISQSIRLNGTVQALSKPTAIGDYDGDGIKDIMVKSNRKDIIELFQDLPAGKYTVEVTGTTPQVIFKVTDEIRVI